MNTSRIQRSEKSIQRDVFGKCRVFFINNLFVMTFADISLTQITHLARLEVSKKNMLDCMRFFCKRSQGVER